MLNESTKLTGWLVPHSLEWYAQLGKNERIYRYPWCSEIKEPNGETLFDKELMQIVPGMCVLDVGCGHGELAMKCSTLAQHVTGFDVTDAFLKSGSEQKRSNLRFVLGNSNEGLPFSEGEFDIAYNRKGPTSSYSDLKRVVKKGGRILGLHPGDDSGIELSAYFPKLFTPSEGKPILDKLLQRLEENTWDKHEIELIKSVEYLKEPIDVINFHCFGQNKEIFSFVKEKNLSDIKKIFNQHAGDEGLPITFSRYIVKLTT